MDSTVMLATTAPVKKTSVPPRLAAPLKPTQKKISPDALRTAGWRLLKPDARQPVGNKVANGYQPRSKIKIPSRRTTEAFWYGKTNRVFSDSVMSTIPIMTRTSWFMPMVTGRRWTEDHMFDNKTKTFVKNNNSSRFTLLEFVFVIHEATNFYSLPSF